MKIVYKNAVLVIPFATLVIFLGTMYSIKPVQVSGSFLMSGIFLFVVSSYISMTIQFKENDTNEEIMLLHSNSGINYYISRELTLLSISLCFAMILTLYPALRAAIDSHIFKRTLELTDVINGGIIIIGNGLVGISLGDFFHQRIFTRKRNAIIGLVLVSVLAICKQSIIYKYSFFKFMNYVMPPVMDGFQMVGSTDIFDTTGTIIILLHTILFALVIMFIKIGLLNHQKY